MPCVTDHDCSGHGVCIFSLLNPSNAASISVGHCLCDAGWSGDDMIQSHGGCQVDESAWDGMTLVTCTIYGLVLMRSLYALHKSQPWCGSQSQPVDVFGRTKIIFYTLQVVSSFTLCLDSLLLYLRYQYTLFGRLIRVFGFATRFPIIVLLLQMWLMTIPRGTAFIRKWNVGTGATQYSYLVAAFCFIQLFAVGMPGVISSDLAGLSFDLLLLSAAGWTCLIAPPSLWINAALIHQLSKLIDASTVSAKSLVGPRTKLKRIFYLNILVALVCLVCFITAVFVPLLSQRLYAIYLPVTMAGGTIMLSATFIFTFLRSGRDHVGSSGLTSDQPRKGIFNRTSLASIGVESFQSNRNNPAQIDSRPISGKVQGNPAFVCSTNPSLNGLPQVQSGDPTRLKLTFSTSVSRSASVRFALAARSARLANRRMSNNQLNQSQPTQTDTDTYIEIDPPQDDASRVLGYDPYGVSQDEMFFNSTMIDDGIESNEIGSSASASSRRLTLPVPFPSGLLVPRAVRPQSNHVIQQPPSLPTIINHSTDTLIPSPSHPSLSSGAGLPKDARSSGANDDIVLTPGAALTPSTDPPQPSDSPAHHSTPSPHHHKTASLRLDSISPDSIYQLTRSPSHKRSRATIIRVSEHFSIPADPRNEPKCSPATKESPPFFHFAHSLSSTSRQGPNEEPNHSNSFALPGQTENTLSGV